MSGSPIALLGGSVSPCVQDVGSGQAFLLLHGGAGPGSMQPLLPFLNNHRCIVPTHPGFDRTPRPQWLSMISDLSLCYLALLDGLGVSDVVIVGNSAGGWIAAEMAIRRPASVRRLVLLNAVGITPTKATGPITDPLSVSPDELASLAFANPEMAKPPTPQAAALLKDNQRTLNIYAGEPFMNDPTLSHRLSAINIPTNVLWGEADRIVTPDYGRVFAHAIPGANFSLIANAGHLPQIEQPRVVAEAILVQTDA